MMNTATRLRKRRTRAQLGFVAFGLVGPTGAMALSCVGVSPYIGLGIVFAAYTSHAFLINRRGHKPAKVVAFGVTVLVGLLWALWGPALQAFFSELPSLLGRRVHDSLGVQSLTLSLITSGLIMTTGLLATTRSLKVAVTTAVVSFACGAAAFGTAGWSSILWNLSVAASLYIWACRLPLDALAPEPPRCGKCRYDLSGLAADARCPECGSAERSDATTISAQFEDDVTRKPTRPLAGIRLGLAFCAILGTIALVIFPPRIHLWGPKVITDLRDYAAARSDVAMRVPVEAMAMVPPAVPAGVMQPALYVELGENGQEVQFLLYCKLPRAEVERIAVAARKFGIDGTSLELRVFLAHWTEVTGNDWTGMLPPEYKIIATYFVDDTGNGDRVSAGVNVNEVTGEVIWWVTRRHETWRPPPDPTP
jgi:hypothetical protein